MTDTQQGMETIAMWFDAIREREADQKLLIDLHRKQVARHRLPKLCKNCRFYDEGNCHRYPPAHGGWPQTSSDSFCGEYKVSPSIKIEVETTEL